MGLRLRLSRARSLRARHETTVERRARYLGLLAGTLAALALVWGLNTSFDDQTSLRVVNTGIFTYWRREVRYSIAPTRKASEIRDTIFGRGVAQCTAASAGILLIAGFVAWRMRSRMPAAEPPQ